MDKNIEKMIAVVPSERQLKWQELEFYGFLHYGLNTYLEIEWGDGSAALDILNPSDMDVEQWIVSMKAAEMKGIVMFCKHHDGFCLWDTKTTSYNIMNTPYGKDLLKEVADACVKYDMKLGLYLSPWDRSHPAYGTESYNDVFIQQLDEILTGYGKVFCVWFDGACGEGKNGKKQRYDWERYYAFIREKQPEAVISVAGPDVRWCGNEAGWHRAQEWSVVPAKLMSAECVAELSQQEDTEEFRAKQVNSTMEDLGSRKALEGAGPLAWYPCEVDTSIRPGWFYMEHDDNRIRPLDELLDIYLNTVGANANLILNVPPCREGYFKKNDVKRLNEIGCFIRDTFSYNLAEDAIIQADSCAEDGLVEAVRSQNMDGYWKAAAGKETAELEFMFSSEKTIDYCMLMEDIRQSQRIEKFRILYRTEGAWEEIFEGTAVGHKKICRFEPVKTDAVKVVIDESRSCPTLRFAGFYYGYYVLEVKTRSR